MASPTPMTHARKTTAPSQASGRLRLHLVFPQACELVGIASIPLELSDAIQSTPALQARVQAVHWVASALAPFTRQNQCGRAHPLLAKIAYRFARGGDMLRRRTVRRMVANCKPGDVVVIYPGLLPADTDALRNKGVVLVHEPVNTAHPFCHRAMQRAYAAAGIPLPGKPDEVEIAEERRRMHPQDLVFVTSPLVAQSVEAMGMPPQHLLPTSYGFNPRTFRPVRRPAAKCRFVFVARGSVRKGLPVLLEAWMKAKIDGQLILVGGVEPEIAARCEAALRHPSVETRPFTRDLAGPYGDADVFVLPSFEEGSPLVSYLALAAGLPCLVSPAAGGWIVRDGQEGIVQEPDDVSALVDNMRRLAEDHELRRRLGAGAALRAADYTWERVAAQRIDAIDQALGRR